MNRGERLYKISLRLTPKQACVNFIAPQLRYQSLADYRGAVCQRWGTESGLGDLCDQVADSVESALEKDAGNEINREAVMSSAVWLRVIVVDAQGPSPCSCGARRFVLTIHSS